MHYSLPPVLFKRGKQSACFVAENLELSETDRKFIASVYPKDDGAGGCVRHPADDGYAQRRPAARRPVEDREALVKRYEELLKQSGIEAGRVRDLVADFRKSATGK